MDVGIRKVFVSFRFLVFCLSLGRVLITRDPAILVEQTVMQAADSSKVIPNIDNYRRVGS